MQGPFSDAVRATVRSMLGYLSHLSDEWACLARALNRAAGEAEAAARMQAVGLTSAGTDPEACLRPYRSWEPAPWWLDPGWAQSHGRGSGHLFLTPDLARRLADHLRDGSEELEFERRRFVQAMEPFGILVPYALTLLADAAWEIADEIERRVSAYERADEEIARSARAPVQSLMAPLPGLSGEPPGERQPGHIPLLFEVRRGEERVGLRRSHQGLHAVGEAKQAARPQEHPWWMAVNGSMMIDVSEAERL